MHGRYVIGIVCRRFVETAAPADTDGLLGHVKLETTTIYTEVAIRSDGRIESPLDVLTKAEATRPATRQRSVGRMQLAVGSVSKGTQSVPSAAVSLTITSQTASVRLCRIVVGEARPGWLSMDLPPQEAWQEPLRWLAAPQRERIESPEFYELLQQQIGQRFLAQRRV